MKTTFREFIEQLPCGRIGTFNGHYLWKYEANEANIESEDHLELKEGDIWFNTEAVTSFDIDSLIKWYDSTDLICIDIELIKSLFE